MKNASDRIGTPLGKNQQYAGKTLFLKGEHSGYIEAQDEFLLKHHIPLAVLVTIPRAGHCLHAENPTDFAQAINAWW